jgi:hypothetical protein
MSKKKPKLLQARAESTMEAVEETNGAFQEKRLAACNIFELIRLGRILASSYAALQ